MKQNLSLDDVFMFLAVADASGLAGAARVTGSSVPTLSRRMAELERRTGRRLFHRGRKGYRLTAEGRLLVDEAESLRTLAARLGRWTSEERSLPRVRITAGMWTSRFLARNISRFWSGDDEWMPEFLASNATVDIARREADIGIRNRRPEQAWLAGRRTHVIRHAVYAAGPDVSGFVTIAQGSATTPSDRWLKASHADDIVTTASDARLALDLALAGVGRIVMPCFAANGEQGLMRISDPIEELTHEEWLVCHHDARHDPPVRKALDAIHGLLTESRAEG